MRQEGIQFHAINVYSLTTSNQAMEQLIKTYDIEPCRLTNRDETGATTDKEALGISPLRTFTPREGRREVCILTFKNVSRVTIVPMLFASAGTGSPLFIFKDTRPLHRML